MSFQAPYTVRYPYNAEKTIRECCEGLRVLDYPDYEVIVVDDGSTDDTRAIAESYDFRLISTENQGRAKLATSA